MRRMRRCLTFVLALLVLVLPLRGFAGPLLPEPCPMEHGQAAASLQAADGHGCCTDQEEAHTTGKPCKAGQECKAGCQVSMSGRPAHGTAPLPDVPVVVAPLFPPSFVSHAVWRPPTIG